MQVYQSTAANYFNDKKRTRSYTDDFESHYLKKRLISNLNNENFMLHDANSIPNNKLIHAKHNTIDLQHLPMQPLDINGTLLLPPEQNLGRYNYSIPDFMLFNDIPNSSNDSEKQLVLYRKNPLLPEDSIFLKDPDNESVTSEENNEELSRMDID